MWEIAVSPHDSDLILAGLGEGIYRSEDGGGHRTGPLPAPVDGRPLSFDWHPADPDLVLAGTALGAWRSTDGGRTWSEVLIDNTTLLPVFAIRFDPTRAGTAYALVYEQFGETGLHVSQDAGATWSRTGLATFGFMTHEAIHVTPAGDLVIAGSYGILRSTDAGQSWQSTLVWDASDFEADRTHPTLLWVAGEGRLWSSLDGGASWQSRRPPPPWGSLRAIVSIPGRARGLIAGHWNGSRWISFDGGDHWRRMQGLPAHVHIEVLTASSGNPGTIWLGSSNERGIWRSTDGGLSWQYSGL